MKKEFEKKRIDDEKENQEEKPEIKIEGPVRIDKPLNPFNPIPVPTDPTLQDK